MFGNLMSADVLKRAFGSGPDKIEIHPNGPPDTHAKKTGNHTYTLYPRFVLHQTCLDGESSWHKHDLVEQGADRLAPGEFVKIIPSERVVLPDGIVGLFCTPSTLVASGLILVAGKLDSGYGRNLEELVFGLHNPTKANVAVSKDTRTAHLMFYDVRGLAAPGPSADYVKRTLENLLRGNMSE